MSEKWTEQQLEAIEKTAGNMIVSASAGSGKTAVMIERVRRLVMEKHVPVSRILMLSFNEAIAQEIKEKMAKVLVNEVKKGKDIDFLQEQIDNLGMADITTMHSFCNSLIKEYFDVVGVDPCYSIMEETESDVVINKSINEIFEEYFENKDSSFIILKDKLTERGEDKLRQLVKEIFTFSNALIDSDKWLDDAYEKNYAVPLIDARPVKLYVQQLIKLVNDTYDALELAYNTIDTDKYTEIGVLLSYLNKFVGEENIIKYSELAKNAPLVTFHRPRKSSDEYENFTNAKNAYSKLISVTESLFPVSYEKMEEDHRNDAVVVKKLFEVVKRFKYYYEKEKREVNKLDFNDLEHYAVEILSHEDIRNDIKKKYDYVCVDEYQDTNEVQDRLLASVSNGNNLFMVGDPKQSIYKFRFTEPELFVDKWQKYGDSKENNAVELDRNFRSSPLILERINDVFDNLMRRSNAGKISEAYSSLVNGLDFQDTIDEPFEVMLYELHRSKKDAITEAKTYQVSEAVGENDEKMNARIEAEYLAQKINSLKGKMIYDVKLGKMREIEYDDMAILSSGRTDAVKIMLEILEDEFNIPINSTDLKKKDEPKEVKILIDFLRAIDNPRQDIPLYTVMKLFSGFNDNELMAMKKDAGKVDYFHEVVFGDLVKDDKLRAKLDVFKAKLDEYRMLASFMNVHDFLISMIEKTSFKKKLLMSAGGVSALENVEKFIVSLKDKKHASNIQEFLYAYDNYNIKNDIDSTSQSLKSSIHTSTIHKSKGLEYPIVFIVGTGAPFIHKATKNSFYMLDKEYGFGMRTFDELNKTTYNNWLLDALIDKEIREETEEKMRLLYVAMTRAKNCLYIVGQVSAKKKSIDETQKFSEWLYYIGEENSEFGNHIRYETISQDEEEIENVVDERTGMRAFDYEKCSDSDIKRYDDVFNYQYPYEESTHLAQKYTVTSINHEEREHEEYVPELYETEKTSVGSIYHKFMENVNYEADTVDAIKNEMQRMVNENILSEEEIQNIVVDDVYKCLNSDIIKTAKVNRHDREKKFMMNIPLSQVKDGASDEKVIIQGIADLVIYGEENILVDFKKSVLPANMLKEAYHKQLEIYKYALEHSMNIKINKMYLYVIGQDKTIELT